MTHQQYRDANRRLWNEWAEINAKSAFYDVAGFKAGRNTLDPLVREEVGDVTAKTLLHLQCHFGMDTLSWARLGAQVTGVDFSERALAIARQLSAELSIPAQFVQSDICELYDALSGQFDIVCTSYGALSWLPDLTCWAEVIRHFLKPGGFFYVAEFHPFLMIFDDEAEPPDLPIRYPYFGNAGPVAYPVTGSYADPDAPITQKVAYDWPHTLGEVVTALAGVGLRIEFLHEFPYTVNGAFQKHIERGEDGWYRLRRYNGSIPLMYSLKAIG